MSTVISVAGVTKRYGAAMAVKDVSFELGESQTVAVVGHNGAGKTTLFKMMLGLTRPSAGTIRVLDTDPHSHAGREARINIGYLPENVAFSGSLTGLETLQFYAALKRRPRAEYQALLERVGLAEAAHKKVNAYSKGMRQRLGLAQALLGAPRLLFLDEPTTGLDPLVRQSFYALVGELRERGVTALLSSHALSELEGRIDHVMILHRGALIASGSLDTLRGLAGLPIHVDLAVAADFPADALQAMDGPGISVSGVNGRRSLVCAANRKIEVLRHVSSLPQVLDIVVTEPTLDQIYAHFLGSKDAEL